MDVGLEKIALSGTWLDPERAMSGDMKDDITGKRRKYVFACPYCDKEYVTDNTYHVTDNYVSEHVKSEFFFKISEFFWHVVDAIPFLGSYFRERADRKLDSMEDGHMDKQERASLLKAFREVEHNFAPCQKCGRYTCTECMQDGVCGFCLNSKEAQGEAARQEMSSEVNQQIQELDKMYDDMIRNNPGQRATLEKQKEEQKKALLAAQNNMAIASDDD